MKTNKIIFTAILGLTLSIAPTYAQRGGGSHSSSGGSRSGGSSHSSMSSSSSRSSSSSHSSSSRSSSSYSGSSRSSSSSYSGSSRSSSSSYSGSRSGSTSYSSPRSSSSSSYRSGTAHVGRSGEGTGNSRSSHVSSARSERSSVGTSARTSAVRSGGHGRSAVESGRGVANGRSGEGVRGGSKGSTGRGGAAYSGEGSRHSTYARPGVAGGVMPPSQRHMHPAPYFYHPIHHHMIHCHALYWDPCCIHHHHWPGFWCYCNNYWYDYHTTDVIVVREYVHQQYGVEMLDYVISGSLMYALIKDTDGETYLQVFDQNDKLIAEQHVHRKYRRIELDKENGGCWIMKKGDKDPLLFIYTEGQLLIYEAD